MKIKLSIIALIALTAAPAFAQSPLIEVRAVAKAANPSTQEKEYSSGSSTQTLNVVIVPIITDADITTARVEDENESIVKVALSESGGRKLNAAIENMQGGQLAIVVKGKLISAPVLMTTDIGGAFQISGNMSKDEASKLVQEINNK